MSSTPTDYDLDLKVAELKITGFTTFENLIAPETIDRMWFRTATIEMTEAEYEKLSDRGRALLSPSRIVAA